LVKQIVKLLNNVNAYIEDFRKCKPDIKFVLDAIDDIEKQHSFVTRILASLCSHSGINLEDEMLDETPPQSKYRELSNWILDTWIPTDKKQEILNNIKSILEGKITVSWTGDLDKYHRLWQEWSKNPKRFEEKYMNIQTTTQA